MSRFVSVSKSLCLLALLAAALSACQTRLSQPTVSLARQVSYGDNKAVETVTNEFGSTDLQMIAEKMVGSLLEDPVLSGRPSLTLAGVRNKTSEYIDTKSIMNTIQTALVKSRKVKMTRSADEMQQGVDELQRQNQSGLYKAQGKAKIGNMAAAKYSLEGEIVSIVKQNATTKDVFYKMTLKLYDIEDGSIEWQEEKEIRKTSKK
ncbi:MULTISPECIES: penicillin-binding protein activator LpoB [unclassified Undibacterium]|uniref:penicillin-binding protein activator LpoB n=1 Tax=unclassified Undibacterium TaxID=2630295 RepID=UPI002AC9838D|nr:MULTISPECIES: penicillin-binding protein activator LpoB [unclassified Undibacterium]MEB0139762.1 penicillin-binding protein activator LpoB [Undibacterium sp. CCC2.1]MEB0172643.1 penicillin-binding protein activator LpoB [Undibacterium sp. CCC1.1]MEB0176376.1 penicillin-binding protein activator LpoB [Undibacterium sp. CCC3.4]MEB0215766.1 penicillin-binding protein activator LpoB [Undibacterium sp. 5I2]WPX45187.1 penicillin-binding protein activator LpoB [Undibacterium sp. CCC3.4]